MTVIDWSTKPSPWCDIGPQFRRECEAILGREKPTGQRIRERRKALGLSAKDLATAAGYLGKRAVAAVYEAEQGISGARRILAALDRLEAELRE